MTQKLLPQVYDLTHINISAARQVASLARHGGGASGVSKSNDQDKMIQSHLSWRRKLDPRRIPNKHESLNQWYITP